MVISYCCNLTKRFHNFKMYLKICNYIFERRIKMKYTIDDFARLIDHTNLHADASNKDMKKLCDEAKKYHFKM